MSMKLFAFALLVAAVAAQDVVRSARSLSALGLGHGIAGVGVAHVPAISSAAILAPAPVAVGVVPGAVSLGAHGLHGVHGLHGIHRRSLLAHGGVLAAPHAVPVLAAPVAIGHAPLLAAPVAIGHGLHGAPLLRHGRSILASPALVGAHGWAAPVAHGWAAPVAHGVVPAIGAVHAGVLPTAHGAHIIG